MAYAQKESYMKLLIEKAEEAFRTTGGNPCVGAMLVHDDSILSIGIHEKYGDHHAEVNCINNVPKDKKHLIKESTLYVTLEPCCIHSKTPPCTSKILEHQIEHVIIATLDINPEVRQNGVAILQKAGVKVEVGLCEKEAQFLLRKFKVNHLEKRPFIAIKTAVSADGYAGKKDAPVWITNESSRIQAHKLRGTFDGIVVGYNTVNLDNPKLTNRLYFLPPYHNHHPIKILIDKDDKLKKDRSIFQEGKNIILTSTPLYKNPNPLTTEIVHIPAETWNWKNLFQVLWEKNFYSLLIEGGPRLQKSIVKEALWDEGHILSSNSLLGEGLRGPTLVGEEVYSLSLGDNTYRHVVPYK